MIPGKAFLDSLSQKKKIVICLAVVLICNFLLYVDTIHYDFLKDDFRLIVENPRIKDFKAFSESIGSKFFAFPDYPYLHYWRPLSLFSFYIDYQLWGLNPGGYHLTNIIINALNGVLILSIFYVLFSNLVFAFFVSLLFSLHPSHVEAVSWISGRTDLLGAFFVFLSLLFFLLFRKKMNYLFYGLSFLFFILGLLSKENVLLFPLMAAGATFMEQIGSPKKQALLSITKIKNWFYIFPFFVAAGIFIILHNRFSGIGNAIKGFSFGDIPVIIKTVGAYIRIILLPFYPVPHFSMHAFDHNITEYLLYTILGIIILIFLIIKRDNFKATLWSLLFFVFLIPVLDPEIVPSYPKIVTRFAYIPAIIGGVFFLEAVRILRDRRLKRIIASLIILIGVSWGIETVIFQKYFKDKYTHYKGLIPFDPEDNSLVLPWALIKAQDGKNDEALELADRVLKADNESRWLDVSDLAGLLKANLLINKGELEQGKEIAEKILWETKKDEMKYFGFLVLSRYEEKKGNIRGAIETLKKAVKIGKTGDVFFRMAVNYYGLGDYKNAIFFLDQAVKEGGMDSQYEKLREAIKKHLK